MDVRDALAAVLPAAGAEVEVRRVPVHEPGTGEALIRMEASGLCHSDVFVSQLDRLPVAPLTIGHEGVGRIEAVGAGVTEWAPGDRVGMTFLASTCGSCVLCRTGQERFCAKQLNFGFTVPGALAEYATVPVPCLVRIPEELDAAEAAPLCCAGWTAYGALRETGLKPGQTVALFGMGGLGHLALQYAIQLELQVAAVDLPGPKLDMARELGAEVVLPAEGAGRTLVRRHAAVDAAVVLTKSTAAVSEAFRALKRTGTLVLVGLSAADYELPMVDTVLKGITIRGSYLGTWDDLTAVFELARAGKVRPRVDTAALDEIPELLERLKNGDLLGRSVIRFW